MVAAPPTEALVVFALVAGAVALFVTEAVPADVTAIGVVGFGEQVDLPGAVGIGLIVAGVYCLNVLSGMSTH